MPPSADVNDPKYNHKALAHHLRDLTDSPNVISHTETDIDKLSYVKRECLSASQGKVGQVLEKTEKRIMADADE